MKKIKYVRSSTDINKHSSQWIAGYEAARKVMKKYPILMEALKDK